MVIGVESYCNGVLNLGTLDSDIYIMCCLLLNPLHRPGFTVLEASNVPKGTFAVMPATWSQLPPKPVPFFITLYSDNVFNFG